MNIARPQTFGKSMIELLRLNILPDIIFGVINDSQHSETRINTVTIPDMIEDDSSDEDVDIMSDVGSVADANIDQGDCSLPTQVRSKMTTLAKPKFKTVPLTPAPSPIPFPTPSPETQR